MNTPPRKISETGLYRPVWREFNRLIDYVREISPVGGRNIRQTRTMNGTLTLADAVSQTPGEPGSISKYTIAVIHDDYWEADDGSLIAKPWRLRRTPFDGQSITFDDENGGTYTVTYNYTTSIKRTATIGSTFTELQVVIPRMKVDFDHVYAMVSDNGTGLTGIDLIDINADGRAWARSRST